MTHDIKILTEHFDLVGTCVKTFEVRRDDRNYQPGDILCLREWRNNMYTGRVLEATITHVYRGEYCRDGYCIISFQLLFPEMPRISVKPYLELWKMWSDDRKQLDACKKLLEERLL